MYKYLRINEDLYSMTQKLYKESFGIRRSISEIKKKYDTSCFELKNVGYFAVTEENDPAAFYGVFPMKLTYKSQDFLIAQSGDTMTAPDHRNKGLFVQLAKMTYELARESGVKFVFGFPNENSLPGFQKKLDWKFYGSMQKFQIHNKVIPLCEMVSKFRNFYPSYKRYCKLRLSKYKLTPSGQNIAAFELKTTKGGIKKDQNFFQYKLENEDIHLIKYDGFDMLIKVQPHLIIGDVGYFSIDKLDSFKKAVSKLAKSLGCRETIFTVSKNHWLFEYLSTILTPEESLPIGFFNMDFEFPVQEISFTQADYDTF